MTDNTTSFFDALVAGASDVLDTVSQTFTRVTAEPAPPTTARQAVPKPDPDADAAGDEEPTGSRFIDPFATDDTATDDAPADAGDDGTPGLPSAFIDPFAPGADEAGSDTSGTDAPDDGPRLIDPFAEPDAEPDASSPSAAPAPSPAPASRAPRPAASSATDVETEPEPATGGGFFAGLRDAVASAAGAVEDAFERAANAAPAAPAAPPAAAAPLIDVDGDGRDDVREDLDDDNDGTADLRDFDRDNDGFEELGDAARFRHTRAVGTKRAPIDATDATEPGKASRSDLDRDGISDSVDADIDGDGTRNRFDLDDDNDGSLDLFDRDDDGDGVLDATERAGAAQARAVSLSIGTANARVHVGEQFDPAAATAPAPPTGLLARAQAAVDDVIGDVEDGVAAVGLAVTGDDDFGSGSGRGFDIFSSSVVEPAVDSAGAPVLDDDGEPEVEVTGFGNLFRDAQPTDAARVHRGDLDRDGKFDEVDDNIDGDRATNAFDIDDDNDGVPDRIDADADGDGFADDTE